METKIEKDINAENDSVYITLYGRMCLVALRELTRLLEEPDARYRNVLFLDFANVEYMDSSFLGQLIYLRNIMVKNGKQEPRILGCVNPKVRNIFSLTGVDDIFKFISS